MESGHSIAVPTKSAYNSEHLEAEKEIKNVQTEDIF